MSLFNVFDVAGSGMNVQSIRLNTTSSNLANANSASSSTDQTYRARYPVFSQIMDSFDTESPTTGVKVMGIIESQSPLKSEYSPGHPLANEDGFVFMPNVNVVEEMANMISASRSYQTNVEVMNTTKEMLMRTLAIGQ